MGSSGNEWTVEKERRNRALLGLGAGALGLVALARSHLSRRLLSALKHWITPELVLRRTITVHCPVEDVYAFWKDFSNYPRFMSYIRHVDVDDSGTLFWSAEGPAGLPVTWHTTVGAFTTNQVIQWKSERRAFVKNSGMVRFHDINGRKTRLDIVLKYALPVGAIGRAVAHVLGYDPSTRIDEDLRKMKELIENPGLSSGREVA